MGGIKAQYDCIKALSETEFYDDLKIIDVPVLVMHGEDDQICPFRGHRGKLDQAPEARHAEIVSRFPAWHADHECRPDQCRHPRIHKAVMRNAPGNCDNNSEVLRFSDLGGSGW